MERFPLKNSKLYFVVESFTESKDKIIFKIPMGAPLYGIVTCSLDKCNNLKLANKE